MVLGFAVSSQTQGSTALEIVIVFQLFAVAFTISLASATQFNCCSMVNI
jgi:hypothetical protein